MHMVDSMVSPVVGGAMYVASGIVAAYSIKKLRKGLTKEILNNKELLENNGLELPLSLIKR